MNNKMLHQATYGLVFVGGLNWGLIGLFDFNLVNLILGSWPVVERVVYVLVGVSAVYDVALMHKTYCEYCMGKKK
jgi:uncharacterized protein